MSAPKNSHIVDKTSPAVLDDIPQTKHAVQAHINYLHELAHNTCLLAPAASSNYLQAAISTAQNNRIPINSVQTTFCNKCFTALIPAINCRLYFRHKKAAQSLKASAKAKNNANDVATTFIIQCLSCNSKINSVQLTREQIQRAKHAIKDSKSMKSTAKFKNKRKLSLNPPIRPNSAVDSPASMGITAPAKSSASNLAQISHPKVKKQKILASHGATMLSAGSLDSIKKQIIAEKFDKTKPKPVNAVKIEAPGTNQVKSKPQIAAASSKQGNSLFFKQQQQSSAAANAAIQVNKNKLPAAATDKPFNFSHLTQANKAKPSPLPSTASKPGGLYNLFQSFK
jgi:RNase P subunit RPR2